MPNEDELINYYSDFMSNTLESILEIPGVKERIVHEANRHKN